ncbi:MAG: prepilin-type N-terminal cleavage/methylation domain-containing protein [Elusimicrobiota bacterium]
MNNNKGFTLMEIVVALVLFSSIALTSVAFFSYGQKQGVKAKRVNYALEIAEEEIEILKTKSYNDLGSMGPQAHTRYGTVFNVNYAANEVGTYTEAYKVVTVTVTWSADGRQRNIELFTILSPDHLNFSGSELYSN